MQTARNVQKRSFQTPLSNSIYTRTDYIDGFATLQYLELKQLVRKKKLHKFILC